LIREAAAMACKDAQSHPPLVIVPPFRWAVALANPSMAGRADLIPGVDRVGVSTVIWSSDDFRTSYDTFAAVALIVGGSGEPRRD
jgi:D-aminopeptidase